MITRSSREFRTEWRRLRAAFGIPSAIIVVGAVFAQTLVTVITNHLDVRGDLIWLATLAAAGLWLFSRFEKGYAARLRNHPDGQASSADLRLASRQALVALIGLDSAAAEASLTTLLGNLPNLHYLVLLGTPETRAAGVAERIVTRSLAMAGLELDEDHILIMEHARANEMSDFELATRQAVSWLLHAGVEAEAIVIDVTSGRRAMGFGALVAAERAGIDVQYLASDWDTLATHRTPGQLTWQLAREIHDVATT
jgi:hypothetical protein